MSRLSVVLLGPGMLQIDQQPVPLRSFKTLALLAFLAIEHDRPHARDRLAALLWPDRAPSAARHNLRQSLHWLRRLGDGALDRCLAVSGDLVQFTRRAAVSVDVLDFLDGVRSQRAPDWAAAAACYRALLLEGRVLDDHDGFTEWLESTRASLASVADQNRRRLAAHAHPAWPKTVDEGLAAPAPAPVGADEAIGAWLGAAHAAEQVYAFGHAVELYHLALARSVAKGPQAGAQQVDILLRKESALDRLGRRAEQWATIEHARSVAIGVGDPAIEAAVLLRKAGACAYAGHFDSGLDAARAARDRFRDAGDRPGEAEALREWGFLCWRADDPAAALQRTQQALDIHRSLGDVVGEASALHNRAEILRGLGSAARAVADFEQSLRLHWAAGHAVGELLTRFGLAGAYRQLGMLERAWHALDAARVLAERCGERTMQARALQAMARHCATTARADDALALLQQAIAIDRSINYAHALGHDLADLAELRLMRGERTDAKAALREASVWFESLEDAPAVAGVRAKLDALEASDATAGSDVARATPAIDAAGNRLAAGALNGGVPGGWVRSHLAQGEGKVYCAFESPLALAIAARRPPQPGDTR